MTSDGRPTAVDDVGETDRPKNTPERRTQTRALVLPETMTVQYLSEVLDQNPIDVIKQLMRNGIMASMNQVVDYQVAKFSINRPRNPHQHGRNSDRGQGTIAQRN
ncbi:MAG: hypothetical protein Ct9H300mP11_08820 [Chloroflexota bacterium]|nr:MAG: hypothetical protein Ct9H300mP11_08820 [Chloroflexota bacterium]